MREDKENFGQMEVMMRLGRRAGFVIGFFGFAVWKYFYFCNIGVYRGWKDEASR